MKAASTVLTGGLGRRTERQRALILPTGTDTLAYLAYDASQSSPKLNFWEVGSDTWIFPSPCGRRHRHTCLPCAGTGEPQRADGAASNTPPPASCSSPPF